MTDRNPDGAKRPAIDTELERTLRSAYPAAPLLGRAFEREVMSRVTREVRATRSRRRVASIMMIYWSTAGLLTCVLVSGGLGVLATGQTPGWEGMLLSGLVTVGGLVVLARAAGLRISQLLFRTINDEEAHLDAN